MALLYQVSRLLNFVGVSQWLVSQKFIYWPKNKERNKHSQLTKAVGYVQAWPIIHKGQPGLQITAGQRTMSGQK